MGTPAVQRGRLACVRSFTNVESKTRRARRLNGRSEGEQRVEYSLMARVTGAGGVSNA